MDFDDVSWATIGHPSVSVAPSVFACAQKGKWNGKQTLLAYVLAVESMHQISRLTMPQLSERGWHTTLAYGVFGAAVPAVRLLGLNEDECANALGIADHIEAGVSLLGPKEMTCHLPQNAVQAKFSLEFALAYRLIFGKLSLSSFTDQNVLAPEIQAMMKKIKMEVSPELAKLGFIGTAPIRLKVYLKDGMAITLSNDLAVGNPEKPLPEQVVKEKFMDCSKGAADQEKAEKWYEILKNLENATQEEILSLGNP